MMTQGNNQENSWENIGMIRDWIKQSRVTGRGSVMIGLPRWTEQLKAQSSVSWSLANSDIPTISETCLPISQL